MISSFEVEFFFFSLSKAEEVVNDSDYLPKNDMNLKSYLISDNNYVLSEVRSIIHAFFFSVKRIVNDLTFMCNSNLFFLGYMKNFVILYYNLILMLVINFVLSYIIWKQ